VHLWLKTNTIRQTVSHDYDDYNKYDYLSTSFMDNRSSPSMWIIFDCNYINEEGGNKQIKRKRAIDTQPVKHESWLHRQWWRLGTKMKSQYLFSKPNSRSTNIRLKWRDAMLTGCYPLQRNQHHYDTEASEATWNINWHTLPPSPWPELWCNIQRTARWCGSQSSAVCIPHRRT
jgi:hypothetical protein